MRYFTRTKQKERLRDKILDLEERLFDLELDAQASRAPSTLEKEMIEEHLERLYQFEDYLESSKMSASPLPFSEWVEDFTE